MKMMLIAMSVVWDGVCEPLYTPEDIQHIDDARDLGYPGEFPFTRGVYPSMYRGRLWTFREYAGFGTAEDSNTRYRALLDQGMTGLSVAFDLPTQIGFDSDDPRVGEEVGRVGVAIDSLADMELLFDGIPLDKVSTNFAINTTSAPILAMYMAVGAKQGVPLAQLRGTLQNDPLKEYIARGTWLFPVDAVLRLTADVMEFCAREVPRFNPISVSGAHIQQAGATRLESVALAFTHAMAYIDVLLERGLSIDDFAPRISWNLGVVGTDIFEEAARFRAARRLWAHLVQERYQPRNPESCMLRVYAGSGGNTLTVEEPLNNIVRVALEVLASALGGAQAIHSCSYDEAYAIPTAEAQLVALRTQQIIAYESGITKSVDPLAGSYYVETLTHAAEQQCARQLTNPWDGFLLGKRYLIHDRDTKFTQAFDALLKDSGVEPLVLPPRSPNLNAHCERFVRSIKEEAQHHHVIQGEAALSYAIHQYLTHYHAERNHQGLGNQLIAPEPGLGSHSGQVRRRERLGGLLSYYYRDAA